MNSEIILQNYLKNRNIQLLNNIGYVIKDNNIYYNKYIVFQVFNNTYYKFELVEGKNNVSKIYEYNKLLSYINIKNNIKIIYSNFKNK